MKKLLLASLLMLSAELASAQGEPKGAGGAGEAQAPAQSGILASDSAKKLVRVQLIAGAEALNQGMNFNGYTNGEAKLVVPLGWTVEVLLQNHDAHHPHSAAVITPESFQAQGVMQPAFPGAMTETPRQGIPQGADTQFSFLPDHPGEFYLVCGVAGHAEAGMWLRLVVSDAATEPRLDLEAR
jgi:sulfocyanin